MANPSENVRDARLRWFGHVESETKEDIVKGGEDVEGPGRCGWTISTVHMHSFKSDTLLDLS